MYAHIRTTMIAAHGRLQRCTSFLMLIAVALLVTATSEVAAQDGGDAGQGTPSGSTVEASGQGPMTADGSTVGLPDNGCTSGSSIVEAPGQDASTGGATTAVSFDYGIPSTLNNNNNDNNNPRMVKMERMRNKMFNPGSGVETKRVLRRSSSASAEGKENVPPAQQIALFKEHARDCMQSRLTELFESTRQAQVARKKAKDLVRERMRKAFEFPDELEQ